MREKRFALSLGLPEDSTGDCARVTLVGQSAALVEGQHGVIELTESRVRLRTGRGVLSVLGEGLRLRELTKGDLSGVATLFSDAVTDTELTALTRVRLLRIPEEALEALIQSSAQAARNTCRFLAGRIRYLNALIDRFAGASVEENLLAYLTQRAAAEGNRFPFSATEAARRLGVGRASVYRALDALAERGLVEKTGRELMDAASGPLLWQVLCDFQL